MAHLRTSYEKSVRRRRRFGPVVLSVLFVATGLGSGAAEAQEVPSITVTPSAGLQDGQSVTVTGSGFSADVASVGLAQCDVVGPEPVTVTDLCIGQTVVPASGGSFSATFTVSRLVLGTDCALTPGRCLLGASNLDGAGGAFVELDYAPLSFAMVPGAPTIGTATASSGQATVSWTAPGSNGGSVITGYVVTPSVGYWVGTPRVYMSTATTQTLTGLTNGWKYRFRVQAINAIGTSGYSAFTNPVVPYPPGNVTLGPIDRPAVLDAPDSVTGLAPLVVLLHGYGSTAATHDAYLGVTAQAASRGTYVLLPNGTPGGWEPSTTKRYWNAGSAVPAIDVDDVAYLRDLIAEAIAVRPIDPDRVYVFGHSNGGAMAQRLACELSGVVTAIATLAGPLVTGFPCAPTQPVSILSLHGDADEVVFYAGGSTFGNYGATVFPPPSSPYPGAVEQIALWAARFGCDATAVAGGRLNLMGGIAGDETAVTVHEGCPQGIDVQLDTLQGGTHVPVLIQQSVGSGILDWLLAHAG